MNNLKTKGILITLLSVLLVLLWSCDKDNMEPVSQATVVEKNANSSTADKASFIETQDALGGYTMFYSVYKSDDFLKSRINSRNRTEATFRQSMISIGDLNAYAQQCFNIVKANNPNLAINQSASGYFSYPRNIGGGFTYGGTIAPHQYITNPFTTNKVVAVIKRTQNNGVILLTFRPIP
jgi:hypothetical protein